MARLRVRKLYLKGFQQFDDVVLDFTGPDGQPVDRVCLIGRNGTGKSTILERLHRQLGLAAKGKLRVGGGTAVEFQSGDCRWLLTRPGPNGGGVLVQLEPSSDPAVLVGCATRAEFERALQTSGAHEVAGFDPAPDLIAWCPPEVQTNAAMTVSGVPTTSLDAALQHFHDWPVVHTVSNQHVSEMWRVLVYLVKKRESDRQDFETRPENLHRTKAQLIEAFDRVNPPVLEGLAALWDRILAPAGLELDVEGARLPVQLTDNLHAYIRVRGTGEQVPYSRLSTGIRDFLFRVGHLYLLYFQRRIERGFVLVDEPENSLFPDFLFDLMDTYDQIARRDDGSTGTQMFFATHSPLVAAQFEPHERIVLEWSGPATVTARKGVAPRGDDPNDLLRKDFGLPHVMGPEGRRQWEVYQSLRKKLRRAPEEEKPALVEEAAKIAGSYGFEPTKPT